MYKTKKQQWLEAYEITLGEYQGNIHKADRIVCAKCILVREDCSKCPEKVFATENSNLHCLYREAGAQSSRFLSETQRRDLIEYHERAVEFLKSMKRFNFKSFQNYLLKVDEEIASK